MIKVGLVFSISNFFTNKTYQANNWSAKKIPSCMNLALVEKLCYKDFSFTYQQILEWFLKKSKATCEIWGLWKEKSIRIHTGFGPIMDSFLVDVQCALLTFFLPYSSLFDFPFCSFFWWQTLRHHALHSR